MFRVWGLGFRVAELEQGAVGFRVKDLQVLGRGFVGLRGFRVVG